MIRSTLNIGLQQVARRSYSSAAAAAPSAAAAPLEEVLFEQKGKCLNVLLNRPKALNALSAKMVHLLTPRYTEIHSTCKDGDLAIVMKGAGEKAFCAGGDIRAIYDGCNPTARKTLSPEQQLEAGDKFFREEYQLNHLIYTSPVPQVSIYNGFTMGGGVGLSIHGKFKVATESTQFAMPETGIGFFCDVGGSHFLPRLPYHMGMYLGLTGAKLKGIDNLISGVTTHYITNDKIGKVQDALESLSVPSEKNVRGTLDSYSQKVPSNLDGTIATKFDAIHRIFGKDSVERIIEELKKDGSDWAKQTIATLQTMSPTSLKVVHRQLLNGAKLDMAECLKMEFRMSQQFVEQHDFFEGVRALLVDKDKNPQWKPSNLSQVTDSMISKYFDHLPKDRELNL
ncbi:3-hydroxyisobutyryl-Coenzyme A hydrolase [Cavenderia fasciculata]|uniref:3-hydroxyisobutyryl-CoA hydrolase n=1 Tax=Cavenderia fasciculata TaxID=261658 RepID=F4Q8U8_CACFS|nr:3-hydroxyisobutyryl-Coenzyme A hydrolase [Cavenderia fasciculata]EGG15117.1 3-hydroxyisobutyryl-Coenzyme A hydrolase [Cavenderia fasciculata]|eukprot:XP_004351837.1 3-hydroxyisobutyryl-Coenzyme A hydrolase [Cavenderia fasciculata]